MSKRQWEGAFEKLKRKEKGKQWKKQVENTEGKAQGEMVENKENSTWVGND